MRRTDKKIQIDYEKILRTADKSGLNGYEMKMFVAIATRINEKGFCETSNEIFTRHFGVSERTITSWINALEEKKLIQCIQNRHKHKRQIYLKMNGLVKVPFEPITNENLMTEAQYKFHKALPDRDIDCEWDPALDMDAVIDEIKKSYFLRNCNMQLSSFKANYNKVIAGVYRDPGFMGVNAKPVGCQREYTRAEMNSLFQDPEDIVV